MRALALMLLVLSGCDACGGHEPAASNPAPPPPPPPAASVPRVTPRVVATFPHDPGAFTQGLVFANGTFIEGTGQYGESSLRRVDIASGRVEKSVPIDANLFGEGVARMGGEVFELTWRDHTCFVYDEATFAKKRTMTYDGEGWGLTTDGNGLLILSDGTPDLRFLEPSTLREIRRVTVKDGAGSVDQLNELELVRGEVYANIWQTNLIARIDPATGRVLGYLDMSSLPEPSHADDPDAVLNGIAYDDATRRLFVTGKRWRSVYEIALP